MSFKSVNWRSFLDMKTYVISRFSFCLSSFGALQRCEIFPFDSWVYLPVNPISIRVVSSTVLNTILSNAGIHREGLSRSRTCQWKLLAYLHTTHTSKPDESE